MMTPLRRYFLAAVACALLLHLYPVRTLAVRAALVASALALWLLLPFLAAKARVLRVAWAIVTAAAVSLMVLAGSAPNREQLRTAYTQSLMRYDGAPYVWGGESPQGIDCSGLVRCGMIDALRDLGLRTRNPELLRSAASLWWHDSSAVALRDGYRGLTRPVASVPSLKGADYLRLLPGDLSVTQSGIHVMAYLGNRTWIEADPDAHRVLRLAVPDSTNRWLQVKMRIVRWRCLDDRS